jgi:nuclear control of ATPase protein 2
MSLSSSSSASLLSATGISSAALYPLELVRQECRVKRERLRRIRDERAEVLGQLADMHGALEDTVSARSRHAGNPDADARLLEVTQTLNKLAAGGRHRDSDGANADAPIKSNVLSALSALAYTTLPEHSTLHAASMDLASLRRPSRLTLAWPRLLLLPPLSIYAVKLAYSNRANLAEMVRDARETVLGFWKGWILDPLIDIVRTVKAGGEGDVIVSAQGVEADVKVSPKHLG